MITYLDTVMIINRNMKNLCSMSVPYPECKLKTGCISNQITDVHVHMITGHKKPLKTEPCGKEAYCVHVSLSMCECPVRPQGSRGRLACSLHQSHQIRHFLPFLKICFFFPWILFPCSTPHCLRLHVYRSKSSLLTGSSPARCEGQVNCLTHSHVYIMKSSLTSFFFFRKGQLRQMY